LGGLFCKQIGEFRLYIDRTLPDFVFKNKYTTYKVIDFNHIFTVAFIRALKSEIFCTANSELVFLMILPNAELYYYKNFLKYGAIAFNSSDLDSSVVEILFEPPLDSPADALAFISQKVAIFSDSNDWCFWGDRAFETAIFATNNTSHSETMERYLGKDLIINPINAISDLLPLAFNGSIPKDFQESFLSNYKNTIEE
jgi:hypothetical protein